MQSSRSAETNVKFVFSYAAQSKKKLLELCIYMFLNLEWQWIILPVLLCGFILAA